MALLALCFLVLKLVPDLTLTNCSDSQQSPQLRAIRAFALQRDVMASNQCSCIPLFRIVAGGSMFSSPHAGPPRKKAQSATGYQVDLRTGLFVHSETDFQLEDLVP